MMMMIFCQAGVELAGGNTGIVAQVNSAQVW